MAEPEVAGGKGDRLIVTVADLLELVEEGARVREDLELLLRLRVLFGDLAGTLALHVERDGLPEDALAGGRLRGNGLRVRTGPGEDLRDLGAEGHRLREDGLRRRGSAHGLPPMRASNSDA